GKWPNIDALRKSLIPGGSATVGTPLMTIASPRPMFLRVRFAEEHLHAVEPGLEVVAKPTGYPELALDARVAEVTPVPVADGQFEAIVEVKFPAEANMLAPGMTAKIELPTK